MSQTIAQAVLAKILTVRGQRVMLDSDLAALYEVEVRSLNQAVKRNFTRFPEDFMYQLSAAECEALRSQIVILEVSSTRGKHRKYRPFVFTEQGVAMLSSVLRSPRAVAVNIEIMRAFVHLRRFADNNQSLAKKLSELEEGYDTQFKVVFDAIRGLIHSPSAPTRRKIGFKG